MACPILPERIDEHDQHHNSDRKLKEETMNKIEKLQHLIKVIENIPPSDFDDAGTGKAREIVQIVAIKTK